MTSYTTSWTLTSLWGWMRYTWGYRGIWHNCSPITYQLSWLCRKVPVGWWSVNVRASYKGSHREGAGRASQPDMSTGMVMEQIILRCCHSMCSTVMKSASTSIADVACVAQAQLAQAYEWQLLLDQPDLLLWQGDLFSGWGNSSCLLRLKQSLWHGNPLLWFWRTWLLMARTGDPPLSWRRWHTWVQEQLFLPQLLAQQQDVFLLLLCFLAATWLVS